LKQMDNVELVAEATWRGVRLNCGEGPFTVTFDTTGDLDMRVKRG